MALSTLIKAIIHVDGNSFGWVLVITNRATWQTPIQSQAKSKTLIPAITFFNQKIYLKRYHVNRTTHFSMTLTILHIAFIKKLHLLHQTEPLAYF